MTAYALAPRRRRDAEGAFIIAPVLYFDERAGVADLQLVRRPVQKLAQDGFLIVNGRLLRRWIKYLDQIIFIFIDNNPPRALNLLPREVRSGVSVCIPSPPSPSVSLSLYYSVYLYLCVCVCVCVCERESISLSFKLSPFY